MVTGRCGAGPRNPQRLLINQPGQPGERITDAEESDARGQCAQEARPAEGIEEQAEVVQGGRPRLQVAPLFPLIAGWSVIGNSDIP